MLYEVITLPQLGGRHLLEVLREGFRNASQIRASIMQEDSLSGVLGILDRCDSGGLGPAQPRPLAMTAKRAVLPTPAG